MIRNFLINTMRNMRNHKGTLILNIAGLTLGLTSFLLIALYVSHELSYDRFHKNYKNIYRIRIFAQLERSCFDQALTSVPMSKALLADYPEVEHTIRIYKSPAFLARYGDTRFNEEGIIFADSSFFTVFDFKLLRGDPKTMLANPRSIVLTESCARKYFGNEDPIGKRISFETDSNLCTVTGVVQNIPSNSHLKFDMVGSLSSFRYYYNNDEWLSNKVYTYIVLKDGTKKKDFEARLPQVVLKYVGPKIKEVIGKTYEDFKRAGNTFEYKLEPLRDIHMKGAPQQRLEPPGSLMNVYIFSVIAILILIIAIINYINLATAKSAGRAKEVGIRKVSGSSKSGLMLQFIGESLITVTIAMSIAVVFVLALLPYFNQLTEKNISAELIAGYKGFLGLVALVLFTGLAAGSYPAFILASYNPVEVLKGTLNPGSISKTLRGILVIFQFTVSIVIIIGAIVIYGQLHYMISYDMGFEKENLIIIRRPDALGRQIESFKEQVLQIPGVEKAANSTAFPGKGFINTAIMLDDDPTKTTYMINEAVVSYGFPEVMGIKLAEGGFFSREYGTDTMSVMINEAALRLLKLENPVGKYILRPTGSGHSDKLRIAGIMKDFNTESLHNKITPTCLTFMDGNYEGYLCLRLNGKNINETIKSIERMWTTYSKRQPFQYSFFAEEFSRLYETEFRAGKIFILFSLLAIFIACLGLIGLMAYMTTIRTREVGIRKTYGASGSAIVKLLSREVLILIMISSLVAFPVAWLGTRIWLEGFAEKIRVSPAIYIVASVLGFAIGWFSIISQAIKAAGYNPAQALSYK
jgi:putative ABC transport system permease protein